MPGLASLIETAAPISPKILDLAWLGDVREVRYPLSRLSPLWMRESLVRSGPPLPQATVPHPESHPYCEFTINLEGSGREYIGPEHHNVEPGSVMLLGPGLPHTAAMFDYPVRAITVYILPIFFLDMGPNGDGARLLKRFTAAQPIGQRILRPPPELWHAVRKDIVKMLEEFQSAALGSELRMRSLVMDALVAILRWEESMGLPVDPQLEQADWSCIQRALQYMHEHHTEVIYVRAVARAVRIGERQLNGMFRELLGMGCIQYLNSYRVSLAAAMLRTSNVPVTTVAFAVGFETLSHFNTTFRDVIGMSPTEYMGRRVGKSLIADSSSLTSVS